MGTKSVERGKGRVREGGREGGRGGNRRSYMTLQACLHFHSPFPHAQVLPLS